MSLQTPQPPAQFVSALSMKQYGTATASLTFVMNIIMYSYSTIAHKLMNDALIIIVALTISLSYVLSFFQRDDGITTSQFLWVLCINSLLVFTSISGANAMLKTVELQLAEQNLKEKKVTQAGIGSFFKHIVFPTQSWFSNTPEPDNKKDLFLIQASEITIKQQQLIDILSKKSTQDSLLITHLSKKTDTLNAKYLQAVTIVERANYTITKLTENDKRLNVASASIVNIRAIESLADSTHIIVNQQQIQQQQQQQQIQQWQQQQQIQQQQQQQQVQQLQQQLQQMQQQQQIQQR